MEVIKEEQHAAAKTIESSLSNGLCLEKLQDIAYLNS